MNIPRSDLLCTGLPSTPCPEAGPILVTGATGYIGGRLVHELLARGYNVVAMVRRNADEYRKRWPEVTVVQADALKPETLDSALSGIHAAYYLIHSLHLGQKEFEAADLAAARNFREAAQRQNVSRIMYLGGLGDVRTPLSPHLMNRIQVAEELGSGEVPVTVLRAAIIIGSGSASYEILKNLIMNLPFLALPSWASTRCQPISVRDVIRYLIGVLEKPETAGRSFDIGGPDIESYATLMKIFAKVLQKKMLFINIPFLKSCRFYGYMASLFTPVPGPLVMSLMAGCKNEVVCCDCSIREILQFPLIPYKEALVRALTREEIDAVYTRWSDSYPRNVPFEVVTLDELDHKPRFSQRCSIKTSKSAAALFGVIRRLGGQEGWFHTNILWRIRGGLDRIFLGVGTSRGRKSPIRLEMNDVVDFWRVEDIEEGRRLLLRAEMKVPGGAWLEFTIDEEKDGRKLSVAAWFDTRSIWGSMYWWAFYPFHHFIFNDLLRGIIRRCE
jgi:uncharacterized protein YbjT (DUF2867 family)